MGKTAVKRPGAKGRARPSGEPKCPKYRKAYLAQLCADRLVALWVANWLVGPCAWSATRRSGRRMGGRGTGGASQSSSRPAGCTGSTWPSRRRRLVLCLLSRPGQVAHDARGKGFNQKTREKSAEGYPAAAHLTAAPATPTTPRESCFKAPGAGLQKRRATFVAEGENYLFVHPPLSSVNLDVCRELWFEPVGQKAKKEKNIVCENCERFLNPNAGLV